MKDRIVGGIEVIAVEEEEIETLCPYCGAQNIFKHEKMMFKSGNWSKLVTFSINCWKCNKWYFWSMGEIFKEDENLYANKRGSRNPKR